MKNFIIGIDISKEKCDATAIKVKNGTLEFEKLDYQVFDNSTKGFRSMVSWARKLAAGNDIVDSVLFVCETTGAYDRAMCDYLYSKGLSIWRESALQIKECSGVRRGKDDRADSLMIAEYAMRHMDLMHLYESPDATIMEIRALFLYRRKLEQDKVAAVNRCKELEATAAKSKTLTAILRDAKKGIKRIEASIALCEEKMMELINGAEDTKKTYGHLTSIPGVGIVNATALIVYTNNFKNFPTSRKLATYWGVASFRSRSGTSVDKRHDVRCYSSSMLKSYITQAAVHTVRAGGIYFDYATRMAKNGKPFGIILNNAKNKLLHLAMSLAVNDCDYEKNHEQLRAERAKTNATPNN